MIELLLLFTLSADAANLSNNFQSAFNSFQPQSPNPPANSFVKEAPQNLRSSGEISPYYDRTALVNDLSQYKPVSSTWSPSLNNQESPTVNNPEWFPSLADSTTRNNNRNNNSDFNEKVALVNPKNYEMSPSSLNRDTKLLSLAYEIISPATCSSSRPLNILHLGTGSGYVPAALAVFSRPVDSILSLDDSNQLNAAKDNVIRDGKGIFLTRLSFNQVINLATAQIPRAPNNLPYDLIVSSKAIDSFASIPRSWKDALAPRGIIIYPETTARRIKVDKIDEYGNLRTIKYI